ncbi:unnamed protein product, partial [Urochloa humidicola]
PDLTPLPLSPNLFLNALPDPVPLSHGRSSQHCISAAEQPPLRLHGAPPPTLPLHRSSRPPLPLPSFSAPSLVSWSPSILLCRSMVWPGKARSAAEAPSLALLLVRALLHLSLATTVLLTKPQPEHSVHQTMSLHLGQQAMIAPAVASRCLPCRERLSVDIFYLKV